MAPFLPLQASLPCAFILFLLLPLQEWVQSFLLYFPTSRGMTEMGYWPLAATVPCEAQLPVIAPSTWEVLGGQGVSESSLQWPGSPMVVIPPSSQHQGSMAHAKAGLGRGPLSWLHWSSQCNHNQNYLFSPTALASDLEGQAGAVA